MSAPNIVIVESPAKAKTIEKYLGPGYEVMASYGHVRDLVNKDGSVLPDEDFSMKWELGDRSKKTVSDIRKAVKDAESLYLATDPDREGEAISWHIKEILEDKKLLKDKKVYRVTFNEITKSAVTTAFQNARELDENLVQAYLARRALDYLVGFNLSPVLWRKLPGSRSAGRVQSVALRLVCERESEIERFNPQEYWTVEAELKTPENKLFTAHLTHLAGNKLDKFSLGNEEQATAAVKRIESKSLSVQKIVKKQAKRNPAPPFITSTLQQEASRKLRMSASQTMRVAQQLYEGIKIDGETVGLITYMRTDGITLSGEAIAQCREVIGKEYGDKYLPKSPRAYKSKAKNAQEAHEAIRPTGLSRLPKAMKGYLDDKQAALYELIWKRTVACQMESAVLDQVKADISDGTDDVVLRANGSVIAFDGFLTLYQEGSDENGNNQSDSKDDTDRRLPPLHEGDDLDTRKINSEQHFTQPPPRYSEASLVKTMEEMGIGRPSTYASILQVLRDRDYVRMEKRRFHPEDRGRIVTEFLKKFFERYVDYEFTANLEEELDLISSGEVQWKNALKDFWGDFKKAVDDTKSLTITEVLDHLNDELADFFFPKTDETKDPRDCQACEDGRLSLKVGKFGAFIGCSNYPDCKFTRPLVVKEGEEEDNAAAQLNNEPKELGSDPDTGRLVTLRRGPYGPYVQLELPEGAAKKDKPKRQGLPRGTAPDEVNLDVALSLLSLPRLVGMHPETNEKIEAGIGRFGPFLKHQGKFKSIPAGDDVLTIGMNRAVELLAQAPKKKKAPAKKKATAKKKTTTKKKTTATKTKTTAKKKETKKKEKTA